LLKLLASKDKAVAYASIPVLRTRLQQYISQLFLEIFYIYSNVFPMRAAHPSERCTNTRQRACRATLRNTTIIFNATRNSKLYLRFFTIIYILYFYLATAGIVPNLAITAAVPLSVHPLYRRFAVLITTTLSLSN
jgi:hypothetical protein